MPVDMNWVRKVVDEWNHNITVGKETTMLLLNERQSKLLHLQRQCYFDCHLCEKEALLLNNKGEVVT